MRLREFCGQHHSNAGMLYPLGMDTTCFSVIILPTYVTLTKVDKSVMNICKNCRQAIAQYKALQKLERHHLNSQHQGTGFSTPIFKQQNTFGNCSKHGRLPITAIAILALACTILHCIVVHTCVDAHLQTVECQKSPPLYWVEVAVSLNGKAIALVDQEGYLWGGSTDFKVNHNFIIAAVQSQNILNLTTQ